MKLSLSISSFKSSKQNPRVKANELEANLADGSNRRKSDTLEPDERSRKLYLTEFDSSEIRLDSVLNNAKTAIPPLQNTNDWRLASQIKRMKNLTLHLNESTNLGTGQLRFKLDTSDQNDAGSYMSYGLNLRQKKTAYVAVDESEQEKIPEADISSKRSSETLLLQKLKDDLDSLPEHKGLEEYEEVPVEGFGAAILSRYGWFEGRGIQKNAIEDVKVKQLEKRTGKEGLGFIADSPNIGSIRKEEMQKERAKEQLQIRDGYSVGKSVRIVTGRDTGLKGRILERVGNDWVDLKLSESDDKVKVHVNDIAELGSKQEERCFEELNKTQGLYEERDYLNTKKTARDEGRRDQNDEVDEGYHNGKKEEKREKKQIPWITSHIRVRIISKEFKGGRFHLKKGKVLDVIDPTTCDIALDDTKEIIQGVSQEFLETAIPRRGGPVLVLYGKHKGVYGSLVNRDLDREVAIVEDADSHELLSVPLEEMAEYTGDPSYLGC